MNSEHSRHYGGQSGKDYFDYQNQGGSQRGKINARKFSKYIRAGDTVLDFGCGNGSLLSHLICEQRIGVEISPIARAEAKKSGLEIYATLTTVPNQSIDVIVSNHALEHVLCPIETLRVLHNKLLPGGRLVLCVPIDDWRTQKYVNLDDINHHLYTWTPLLLGHLLNEAGFKIERVWIYTHAWPISNWQKLDSLFPVWLFDLVCRFSAVRYKRRQIMALAMKE